MKSRSKYLIIAAIVCAVILIGELYAYMPIDRYDSKISVDGNQICYEISSSRPVQYSVILMDNTDYEAIDTLYIYRDANYKICMNDSDHQYYLDKLETILKVKGFSNYKYVDTEGMYSLFEGSGKGKGLLLSTGAIPILSDNPSSDIDALVAWINNGGSLYWTYGIIGEQLSYTDKLVESDYYNLLINPGIKFSNETQGTKEDQYGARLIFSLEQYNLKNAPLRDTVTVNAKYFGFGDGNAYAVTSIEKGCGQICILSGYTGRMDAHQIRDLATVIGSGLSCFTDMAKIKCDMGSFNKTLIGSFDKSGYNQNTIVYINLGGNYSVYSERHVVC